MHHYRNDIEGLRSVAVIPILLFHAGIDWLRGGYTGVDIFFVISGFLITQIIVSDIESDRFSIVGFYQRRVARILPALFFMFAMVGLFAGFILRLPNEIASFFHSLAASSAFSSNIYFWGEVGYFARAAESMALLHTWSLGVEEQFYIFFPILIFAMRNASRKVMTGVLFAILLISLIAGSIIQQVYPTSDFYLLPFRAWELLIGSILAVGAIPVLSQRLNTLASIAGSVMITASILFLVNWLPFPSPLALLPCVGTALLIAYGEKTFVGRILSLAPLRWIGKISFSLYLWHWPIITFYREMTGSHLDLIETVMLIAASFAMAAFSFRFVETPARDALRNVSPSRAVFMGGGATATFIVGSLLLAANAATIWPVSKEVERVASYVDYKELFLDEHGNDFSSCFVADVEDKLDEAACLTASASKRNVLLFGDSHAEMYGVALRRKFPGINWMQATHFGCPPMPGGWSHPGCVANVALVFDGVLPEGKLDGVVMISRWRIGQMALLDQSIKHFIAAGVDVTVIGPVPEYQGAFPLILARAMASGNLDGVHEFRDLEIDRTEDAIRSQAEIAGARYVSVTDAMCKQNKCTLFAPDGGPIAFDYGHLTLSGALYAIRDMPPP